MPKGRVYGPSRRAPRRPTSRSARRASSRDPDSMARFLKPEELRLYRLIWQRAIASQMAAKEMETTSIELEAGRLGLRASATRTLFDGFSRVYTEGRDDDGEDEEAETALPALAEGERADVRVGDPDPALHRTTAPLHGSDAHQGPRGARHRAPVDVRGDDLHDRRSGLRRDPRTPAPPRARGWHRHGPARRALR